MNSKQEMQYSFKLDDVFVDQYKTKTPPFGFNGLGETIYRRTYSRVINGVREKWYQTVRRVVEGTYSIQMNHINMNQLGWNNDQGQRSAQEMYDLIFNMKFLPPGRGLYCMGTNIVRVRKALFIDRSIKRTSLLHSTIARLCPQRLWTRTCLFHLNF